MQQIKLVLQKNKVQFQAAVAAAFALLLKYALLPKKILAAITDKSCKILINGEEVEFDPCPNTLCDLNPIVANLVRNAVYLASIALFVMLVIGGISYLTSGGDPKGTEKAKSTLTFAIVGIVLLVLAWFALLFIKTFTGVDVTTFYIPCPTD